LINGKGEVINGARLGLNFFKCSIRQMNILNFKGEDYLLVTPNNDWVQLYKF
jgi:enediyne biosynthesis protein E4